MNAAREERDLARVGTIEHHHPEMAVEDGGGVVIETVKTDGAEMMGQEEMMDLEGMMGLEEMTDLEEMMGLEGTMVQDGMPEEVTAGETGKKMVLVEVAVVGVTVSVIERVAVVVGGEEGMTEVQGTIEAQERTEARGMIEVQGMIEARGMTEAQGMTEEVPHQGEMIETHGEERDLQPQENREKSQQKDRQTDLQPLKRMMDGQQSSAKTNVGELQTLANVESLK